MKFEMNRMNIRKVLLMSLFCLQILAEQTDKSYFNCSLKNRQADGSCCTKANELDGQCKRVKTRIIYQIVALVIFLFILLCCSCCVIFKCCKQKWKVKAKDDNGSVELGRKASSNSDELPLEYRNQSENKQPINRQNF